MGKQILILKVSEANPKDVGRAITRVDPKDMELIGASVGDIVSLEGKRTTVAKLMPAFPDDRGKKIIQVDGLIRENAKVGIGEKLTVTKTEAQPLQKMTLTPLSLTRSLPGDRYLGSLLEGIPVMVGDRIRANLFGANSCDFRVESLSPSNGAGLIAPQTQIVVTGTQEEGAPERRKGSKVSYEDIGGLKTQTQRIREMIELPLKYPQIFQRLGIDAPKGVLLLGPPGCGKTLIARAVANETDAYFTHISGPEIMGKYYGESEARLRGVFDDAKANAPAIVFIDEIDSIAPKREEMGGEKQVEKRVVAQLLALMDGLEGRGETIVIAATNIPNVLDPALRRPGRFDREITIPIPDRNARREILDIHTRGMPLAEGVDLDRIADITHGFVGADLEALAREAAMSCLRMILPKVDFELDSIPYETIQQLEVKNEHFLEALKEVEPSAIREVFVEVPNVHWEDIGGLETIKTRLAETVEWPLRHEAVFDAVKVKPPKGILIFGPPGTGKTLLGKALATELEVNFITVRGPELMSKYVGESERGVREVFRKARQAAPVILFLDEFDSLVPTRSGRDSTGVTERVIGQFLTELDGIVELKGVLVLAATNRIDLIDSAILRAGRFDLILELPMPDEKGRLAILKIHTKGKPFDKSVDLEELAKKSEGLSGADLEVIAREAAMLAIREVLHSKAAKPEAVKITQEHFTEAMKQLVKQRGAHVAERPPH